MRIFQWGKLTIQKILAQVTGGKKEETKERKKRKKDSVFNVRTTTTTQVRKLNQKKKKKKKGNRGNESYKVLFFSQKVDRNRKWCSPQPSVHLARCLSATQRPTRLHNDGVCSETREADESREGVKSARW